MRDMLNLIEGLVMVNIGVYSFFLWKRLAVEVQKFSFVKYGKFQEIGIRACFYFIGIVFILSGIHTVYKFFTKSS